MRYFVTGATGFIGGVVVRKLLARGDEVVALVRDPGRARHLADQGVELAAGDVADAATLRDPMAGVDGVFHIAGWYKLGVDERAAAWATNVDGTANVLDAMADLGIARGVYTSTLAVNSDTHGVVVDESYHFVGRHLSRYDATKAEAHRIALARIAEGLPLVVAMPGLVYGPDDPSAVGASLRQLLRGRLPALPRGTAYCWAHVEDTADGHLQAMDRGEPGEAYMICGPVHSVMEAMTMAADVAEVRRPVAIPDAALRSLAPVSGLVGRFLPVPPEYTPEGIRVAAGVTYLGSNEKARRELGFDPRPLEVGWPPVVVHERAGLA
jgi:nucleoside-diphosphate-sugar epimerase